MRKKDIIKELERNLPSSANVGKGAKQGIMWTFFYNSIQFFARFVGSIILARILFPQDFGLMGIATIVIQLSKRLGHFGFGMVLIQRKENKEEHYQTVFVTNLVINLLLTTMLVLSAPYIAIFFDNPKVEPIMMVLAFDFVVQAFMRVQRAILTRSMKFKERARATTIGAFTNLFSAVVLALCGFGVWSLVLGHLLGSIVESILIVWHAGWLPNFRFHFWAFKEIFTFGAWIQVDSFLTYAINKIDFFVIGKILGAAQLGFYERAFNLISLPRHQINLKINKVLISAYSRIQEDKEKTVQVMLKIVRLFSLFTYPLMAWFALTAPTLIPVLYGLKWAETILPLQVLCIAGVCNSLALILNDILLGQGLIEHRTKIKFFNLVILSIAVVAGCRWGIIGVACSVSVASVVQLLTFLRVVVDHLPLRLSSFFAAQRSVAICTAFEVISGLAAKNFFSRFVSVNSYEMLIILSAICVSSFLVAQKIFCFDDITEIFDETLSHSRKWILGTISTKQCS